MTHNINSNNGTALSRKVQEYMTTYGLTRGKALEAAIMHLQQEASNVPISNASSLAETRPVEITPEIEQDIEDAVKETIDSYTKSDDEYWKKRQDEIENADDEQDEDYHRSIRSEINNDSCVMSSSPPSSSPPSSRRSGSGAKRKDLQDYADYRKEIARSPDERPTVHDLSRQAAYSTYLGYNNPPREGRQYLYPEYSYKHNTGFMRISIRDDFFDYDDDTFPMKLIGRPWICNARSGVTIRAVKTKKRSRSGARKISQELQFACGRAVIGLRNIEMVFGLRNKDVNSKHAYLNQVCIECANARANAYEYRANSVSTTPKPIRFNSQGHQIIEIPATPFVSKLMKTEEAAPYLQPVEDSVSLRKLNSKHNFVFTPSTGGKLETISPIKVNRNDSKAAIKSKKAASRELLRASDELGNCVRGSECGRHPDKIDWDALLNINSREVVRAKRSHLKGVSTRYNVSTNEIKITIHPLCATCELEDRADRKAKGQSLPRGNMQIPKKTGILSSLDNLGRHRTRSSFSGRFVENSSITIFKPEAVGPQMAGDALHTSGYDGLHAGSSNLHNPDEKPQLSFTVNKQQVSIPESALVRATGGRGIDYLICVDNNNHFANIALDSEEDKKAFEAAKTFIHYYLNLKQLPDVYIKDTLINSARLGVKQKNSHLKVCLCQDVCKEEVM